MTMEGHKKMTYLEIQRTKILKILVEVLKEGFTEEGTLDLDLQDEETFATSSCEGGKAPRPRNQPMRR